MTDAEANRMRNYKRRAPYTIRDHRRLSLRESSATFAERKATIPKMMAFQTPSTLMAKWVIHCFRSKSKQTGSKSGPRTPEKLFKTRDKNQNGKLRLKEYACKVEGAALARTKILKHLDVNGDGKATRAELKKAEKIGLVSTLPATLIALEEYIGNLEMADNRFTARVPPGTCSFWKLKHES